MKYILLGKLALATFAAVGSLAVYKLWRRVSPSSATVSWSLTAIWLVSRLGIFALLYVILDISVPSDVPSYYVPQARSALDGLLVYRDFVSNYGPLFPYLVGVPLLFWNTPSSIVLLAVLFEGAALLAWTRVGKDVFEEQTVVLATLVYLCSGVVILNVAVAGQNQVWLSAGLAFSLLLIASERTFLSGLAAGLGLLATKILFLVPVPALFFGAQKRLRWMAGFLLVGIFGYAAVALAGGNVLMPILNESGNWTSGNLPYLFTLLGLNLDAEGVGLGLLILLAGSLAATYLAGTVPMWKASTSRLRRALLLVPLLFLVLLLVSKKAYTNYLAIFYFPLALALASQTQTPRDVYRLLSGLGFFNVIAALEPSMWYRWLDGMTISRAWVSPEAGAARVLLFTGLEIILLAGYVSLALLGFQALRGQRQGSGFG